MLSDDTEHTIFVTQALLACGGDPLVFQRCLAAKLRWWLAGLPAGVGLATAKAILKLWLGFPPGRNGVFSAGNGPVMRAPVLGVYFAGDPGGLAVFVKASTVLTHTDPIALEAALMAAECAAFSATEEPDIKRILRRMKVLANSPVWAEPLKKIEASLTDGLTVEEFAAAMGCQKRVSGYAVHTLVMALFIWLRHRGDFIATMEQAIACGGDTDTVAAIVGGIAGAEASHFNPKWLGNLFERPYTADYLRRLGTALAGSRAGTPTVSPPVAYWQIPFRNLVFLVVVLLHGFRRIFPPY